MFTNKIPLFLFLVILFAGCSKKTDQSQIDKVSVVEEIQLNVENDNERQPSETAAVLPSSVQNPSRTQSSTESSVETAAPIEKKENNYFLSGRTDLLSVKTSEYIFSEDYIMGPLYNIFTATAEENLIISNCSLFLKSLNSSEILYEYVNSNFTLEMGDYIDFFIKDKIIIEDIVFGKPEISGNNAVLNIRINPESIRGYIYLDKGSESAWFVNGLELDLGKKDEEGIAGKWTPSVTPSPFGY